MGILAPEISVDLQGSWLLSTSSGLLMLCPLRSCGCGSCKAALRLDTLTTLGDTHEQVLHWLLPQIDTWLVSMLNGLLESDYLFAKKLYWLRNILEGRVARRFSTSLNHCPSPASFFWGWEVRTSFSHHYCIPRTKISYNLHSSTGLYPLLRSNSLPPLSLYFYSFLAFFTPWVKRSQEQPSQRAATHSPTSY